MDIYENYKDSGIDWVGKVPASWKRSRIKFLLSHSSAGVWGEDEKGNKDDIVCFRAADFDYPHGCLKLDNNTVRNILSKQLEGRVLHKRDLLIEKSGGGDATPVGRIVRFNYDGIATCSNFMHFISVNKNNDDNYLFYYFYAMYANNVNILYFNQTTGIQNLKVNEYLGQIIFIPSLKEQSSISSYLDKKCSEIDNVISAQQKRIALLQELKQSVITHAVTKGLDPNVEMKDSGVEWIGKVPSNWEVAPIKRYSNIHTGNTPSTKEERYYDSEDINWFTPGDFYKDSLNESSKKISEISKKENACRIFPAKSVYMIGIGGTIGKIAICEEEASANQQINIIVPNANTDYKYLAYCMRCQKTEIILSANVVTLPIINQDKTGYLFMPHPKMCEQKSIADYLDKKCISIDAAISKAQHQVELLQEYKQSLITEVVTGKRKVS